MFILFIEFGWRGSDRLFLIIEVFLNVLFLLVKLLEKNILVEICSKIKQLNSKEVNYRESQNGDMKIKNVKIK